jgi:hypothetical protein
MDETNLLSLIKPWLDTNYQITTKKKSATVTFRKIFQNQTRPRFEPGERSGSQWEQSWRWNENEPRHTTAALSLTDDSSQDIVFIIFLIFST